MTNPLLLHLEKRDALSPAERDIILEMSANQKVFPAKVDIVREGDNPTESCMLLSGFSARYHILADGKRQISAIHVPGDFVDLHSFLLARMDHSVAALTDCRVAMVPHTHLRELSQTQPHLTRLLWLSTLIDAAIHRRWIVTSGRLSAAGQLAHLICEMFCRLQVVEMVEEDSFRLPISQIELGDALGLSTVHINRTIRELRERDLIRWQNSQITIVNWTSLKRFAQFEPIYLNLEPERR
ncbi:Crp/Fnr family transcriptional regulator [Pararhizobium haloflavum]|uniref:Crp/Fnr family transcriptional regulator n=1 Tax=Pararhizobium haloflavum TaxID=2037914 RepID=UPI0018E45608|nr:Crp/Fnr family transcriptional regulator [Pararhizobium haloflavum]